MFGSACIGECAAAAGLAAAAGGCTPAAVDGVVPGIGARPGAPGAGAGAVGANVGAPGAVVAGAPVAGSVGAAPVAGAVVAGVPAAGGGGAVWPNEVSAKVSEQRVAVSNVFIDVREGFIYRPDLSDESSQLSPMEERRVEQNFSQSRFRVSDIWNPQA